MARKKGAAPCIGAAQAGGILESFHGLYYHPCPPFATGAFVERRRTRSKRVAAFIFVKIDKTENLQIDLLAIFPFRAIIGKSEEGVG